MQEIELTEEEKANGWTKDRLRAYLRERSHAQAKLIYREKQPEKPGAQNHRYNPLKWRR